MRTTSEVTENWTREEIEEWIADHERAARIKQARGGDYDFHERRISELQEKFRNLLTN